MMFAFHKHSNLGHWGLGYCAVANRKLHMDAKVIQAGRFDQKTSAAERKRILEELVKKDAVCLCRRIANTLVHAWPIVKT